MSPLLIVDDLDESSDPPDLITPSDDDEMVPCDGFEEDDEDEEFVERDPSGRYCRYAEVLGRGASKTVYRAYDRVDCKEVAWNQAKLLDSQGVAVQSEVALLRSLEKHKGIIKLLADWMDTENGTINFITELCSATLIEYRTKHKHASRKAVKSWGRQILKALVHLHSQSPPVVHRDLKCSNIFVKSSANSTLKLGDFGLATTVDDSTHRLHAVVGTPEFMAPEMFEEEYDELVDVYSFGMCMLELLTREFPYRECKNVAQIYKKVTCGVKPKSLSKVKDTQALRFITRCLLPACQRPSANDLLADPFLAPCSESLSPDSITKIKAPIHQPQFANPCATSSEVSDHLGDHLRAKTTLEEQQSISHEAGAASLDPQDKTAQAKDSRDACTGTVGPMNQRNFISCHSASQYGVQRQFRVTGKREDEATVHLKLRIQESCRARDICFPFHLRHDSPRSVAEEMVRELQYPDSDLVTIANLIAAETAALAGLKPARDVPPAMMRHVSSDSDLVGSINLIASTSRQLEMTLNGPPTLDSQLRRFTVNPKFVSPCFQGVSCHTSPIFTTCAVRKDAKPSSDATNSGVNQFFTENDSLLGPFHLQTVRILPYHSHVFA